MKKALLPFIALVSLFSCHEEDTPEPPSPTTPAIVLDAAQNRNIVLGQGGGSETVSFIASDSWTASMANSRADSWISVSPSSGEAGKFSVKVSATANDGFDDRNATLKITSGGQSESVVFTQKQKDAITLSTDKVEVGAPGGVITIDLKSNVVFTYVVAEECASWIKPVTTRSYDSHSVQFSVSENLDLISREGSISFKSGDLSETVHVYQDASEPRIIISGDEYVVGSEGGRVTIEVGSNVSVSMSIPKEISWIREEATRSYSTNTFNLIADPNPDPESRTAVVTFHNEESGFSEQVTIIQKQKDTMTLSSGGEVEIGAEGGIIEVELMSNVDFNVSIDEACSSWIKAFSTRSYDSYSLKFIISGNEELSPREGSITLLGESLHETVLVRQAGAAPTLKIAEKNLEIPSSGGGFSVVVISNVPVTLMVPDTVAWVHESGTRALSEGRYDFSADKNPYPDDRSVEILFVNEEHGLSEVVTVVQRQDDQINPASQEVKVSYMGGSFDITLETNVEYKVTSDATWFRETQTRGLVSHTHTFVADPLPDEEYIRSTEVTLSDASGGLERKVTVIQEDDSNIITFKDETAKQVCVKRFDRNSDGELSEREAALVTSFGYVMSDKADMTSFDEFVYFTGLTEVPQNAFRGCQGLVSITLPPNITSIGDAGFYGCNSLRIVDCQGVIDNIGAYAFGWCTALEGMAVKAANMTIGDYAFFGCESLGRFSVSGEVTSIGNFAFYQSLSLRRFECLSSTPPPCGSWPFGATEMERGWIVVPEGSVESYKNSDYWRDFSDGIISAVPEDSPVIDFKDSEAKAVCVEHFDRDGDGELSELEASVVSSFRYVLNYNDKITSFDEFVYFTGITEIPDWEFYNCKGLRSVTLPSGITSIGDHCFRYCESLERAVIPEGVTSIGEYSFQSCYALQSLTISSSVKRIGDGAFSYCSALEYIEVLSRVPPEIVGRCLYRTGDQYIYVPDGTASDYQEAEGWREVRARITEKGHKPVEFFYVSTDYSRDGELVCLQKATKGEGIELVFLGDGYLDKDMAPGGKYETIMRRWMEQFFVYEPFKSFREWFTIYTIKVVSRHDAYGSPDFERRLTKDIDDFSGDFSNAIDVLYDPVREYLAKALSSDNPSAHRVAVFMNTEASQGRSFCSYGSDNYCRAWIFDSIDERPTVLNHELGHGLGWLLDEYIEYPGQACSDPRKYCENNHAVNIDWRNDAEKVSWSHFLKDSRYANEGLGVFEGAFYAYGLYRPTENSLMCYDFVKGAVFNAPSREQLYKKIMRWGNGDGWTYDYETFVKADEAGRKQAADAFAGKDILEGRVSTRQDAALESEFLPGLPPIVTDRDIREVIIGRDGKVTVKYR